LFDTHTLVPSVNGKLESMVVQTCMITGSPLSSSVYTEFEFALAEAGDSQTLALLSEESNLDLEEVINHNRDFVHGPRW